MLNLVEISSPTTTFNNLIREQVREFYFRHLRRYFWVRVLRQVIGHLIVFLNGLPIHPISLLKDTSWQILDFIRFGKQEVPELKPLLRKSIPCFSMAQVRQNKNVVSTLIHRSLHEGQITCVFLTTLKNKRIIGKTNIVFGKNKAILHELINISTDSLPEELHHRILVQPGKRIVTWLKRFPYEAEFEEAAIFTDACAANYAHFLTEVLPRLALFCSFEEYSHVPLIIDQHLHQNMHEAIEIFAGQTRQIYSLAENCSLYCHKIHVVSPSGYIPFDKRGREWAHHGRFNAFALGAMRQQMLAAFPIPVDMFMPGKIYLKRRSVVRDLLNQSEIETMLVKEGFTIIEGEKLSLGDQVRVFSQASHVVGPTGAGMANLLFLSAGHKNYRSAFGP